MFETNIITSNNIPIAVNENILSDYVTLNKTYYILQPNKTFQLIAIVYPENAIDKQIIWESNNTNVLTVDDNGNVISENKKGGSAVVTAKTSNGKYARCKIYVLAEGNDIPAYDLKFKEDTFTIPVGTLMKLEYVVSPDNATTGFLWSSSNTKIATVTNDGIVTGLKRGTAKITVKRDYALDTTDVRELLIVSCKIKVISKNEVSVTVDNDKDVKSTNQLCKKASFEDLERTYYYNSDSLKIIGSEINYNGTKCHLHTIWMQSPGNQIKKVNSDTYKASSTKDLISKVSSDAVFVINAETKDRKRSFVSVENGKLTLERNNYSSKEPRNNGFLVNQSGVFTYVDKYQEQILQMEPGFTFSASNIPSNAILVMNGQVYDAETDNKKSARNVFGLLTSNTYFTLTSESKKGLTLNEVKDLCVGMGASWAICLDGGTSTALYRKNKEKGLENVYQASSKNTNYSLLYMTEYEPSNLAPVFVDENPDADYDPFVSEHVVFLGQNPLSNKINPDLGKRLEKLSIDTGKICYVNSGFRTTEWQRTMWEKRITQGYTINTKGGLNRGNVSIVAVPGHSPHRTGNATDLFRTKGASRVVYEWTNKKLISTYGIWRPFWESKKKEKWHFELKN